MDKFLQILNVPSRHIKKRWAKVNIDILEGGGRSTMHKGLKRNIVYVNKGGVIFESTV